MNLSNFEKENIKRRIVKKLKSQSEIEKIVIFGSFLKDQSPRDIDVAIFQNSKDNYLQLSLKYRKAVREISKRIPIDIIPILTDKTNDFILNEIGKGEVIFERRRSVIYFNTKRKLEKA